MSNLSVISVLSAGNTFQITLDDTSPVLGFLPRANWGRDNTGARKAGYFAGTGRLSNLAGDSYALKFYGQSLAIKAGENTDHGNASVIFDGRSFPNITTFAGSLQSQVTIFTASELDSKAEHVVNVTNLQALGMDMDFATIVVPQESGAINTTTIDDSSPLINYVGSWNNNYNGMKTYYNRTGHLSTTTGDSLSFNFTDAHTLAVYGGVNVDHSTYTITLDGVTSYFDGSYPSFQRQAVLGLFQNLDENTMHTLEVVNTGLNSTTKPNFDIDFIVLNGTAYPLDVPLAPGASSSAKASTTASQGVQIASNTQEVPGAAILTAISAVGGTGANSADKGNSSISPGAIFGVVVASLSCLAAFIAVLVLLRRRMRKAEGQRLPIESQVEPYDDETKSREPMRILPFTAAPRGPTSDTSSSEPGVRTWGQQTQEPPAPSSGYSYNPNRFSVNPPSTVGDTALASVGARGRLPSSSQSAYSRITPMASVGRQPASVPASVRDSAPTFIGARLPPDYLQATERAKSTQQPKDVKVVRR